MTIGGFSCRQRAPFSHVHVIYSFMLDRTVACKTGFPIVCSCRNFYLALDKGHRHDLTQYG